MFFVCYNHDIQRSWGIWRWQLWWQRQQCYSILYLGFKEAPRRPVTLFLLPLRIGRATKKCSRVIFCCCSSDEGKMLGTLICPRLPKRLQSFLLSNVKKPNLPIQSYSMGIPHWASCFPQPPRRIGWVSKGQRCSWGSFCWCSCGGKFSSFFS